MATAVRIDRLLEWRMSELKTWSIRSLNCFFDKLVRHLYSSSVIDRSSLKSKCFCSWKNICHVLIITCTSFALNSLYWADNGAIRSIASDVKRRLVVCSGSNEIVQARIWSSLTGSNIDLRMKLFVNPLRRSIDKQNTSYREKKLILVVEMIAVNLLMRWTGHVHW